MTTRGPSRSELACAGLAAAVVFVVFAWPWVRVADTAIPDAAATGNLAWGADARLIVWILGWVAHALWFAPSRVFDAPIFHPVPRMLAGSEHLASSVVVSGPVYAATGNPVLAANVAAMSTYVLGLIAAYALLRSVRLPIAAAAVGAAAFALGPLAVPADLHVLQYPSWYLALVLLAAVRVEEGAPLAWLVGALTLALFSSYYVAAMALALIGVEAGLVWRWRSRAGAARLLAAAVPGMVALAVWSVPYVRAHEFRTVTEAIEPWTLASRWLWRRMLDPRIVYPGFGGTLMALAAAGLVLPWLRRSPGMRWWRWTAIVLVGAAFAAPATVSIGTIEIPMPSMLLAMTPLRANTRFVLLAHLGLIGLAAESVAVVDRWLAANRKTAPAVRVVVAVALVAGAWIPRARHLADQPLTRLPTPADVPPVYRWLATHAAGPLLEPPGPSVGNWLAQSDSMVLGLYHGLPLLNGHTGYAPWQYRAMQPEFARLPARDALQTLVDLTGLSWILVRRDRVPEAHFARWQAFARASDAVHVEPAGRGDLLLRVLLRPRRGWAVALARARRPNATALGTPLAALDDGAVRGRVAVRAASTMATAATVGAAVDVENTGSQTWPVMVPPGAPLDGVVRLEVRWIAQDGHVAAATEHDLPRDLGSNDRIRFRVEVAAPEAPGRYDVTGALHQQGGASMRGVSTPATPVVVVPSL